MLRAAIFDWDGVIVDTKAAHERSWEMLAEEERRPLPEGHFLRGFGRKNAWIIPELLQWTRDPAEIARLGDRKEALYREVLAGQPLAPLPGVRALLEALAAAGLPRAVGSSTPRVNIETIFDRLVLRPFFGAVVTAEDVTRGKPDPEVFLIGAARLGVDPADCVVFEDAPFGLEAAKRGGMKAVGITTSNPREVLAVHADLIVETFAGLTLDRLRALWA